MARALRRLEVCGCARGDLPDTFPRVAAAGGNLGMTDFSPYFLFAILILIFTASHCWALADNICKRNGKIRLAPSGRLRHSHNMNLGRKALEQMASGRCEHCEPAGRSGSESRSWLANAIRLAMILQVPIGYEDERGFHGGSPPVEEAAPGLEVDQANLLANRQIF